VSTLEETEQDRNNNNSNNSNLENQLDQAIKKEQEREMSYIMEAQQADDKRTKYLAKKSEYKIAFEDGSETVFKRKPLSSKKNKEIDDLRLAYFAHRLDRNIFQKVKVRDKEFSNLNDILEAAYKKTAEYCLGLTEEQYDNAIWEDDLDYMQKKDIYGLKSVITACLLRAVHGVAYFHQP
jgi:hypothetical protein